VKQGKKILRVFKTRIDNFKFQIMNSTKKYRKILSKCKFISKLDEWFVEGTEGEFDGIPDYDYDNDNIKFNDNSGYFQGITNETYDDYDGELPRHDGEVCQFEEFFIYDEHETEISEMTLYEYKRLLLNKKLKKL